MDLIPLQIEAYILRFHLLSLNSYPEPLLGCRKFCD